MQHMAKDLELDVKEELVDVGGTYKTKLGTVYTSKRTSWTYHSDVEKELIELKNDITSTKEIAKEEGRADKTESMSISFRENL